MRKLKCKSAMNSIDISKFRGKHDREEEKKARNKKFNDRLKSNLKQYFGQYKKEMLKLIPESNNAEYHFFLE